MKIIRNTLHVLLAAVLAACGDSGRVDAPDVHETPDRPGEKKAELTFTTTLLTRAASGVKTRFADGDALCVYIAGNDSGSSGTLEGRKAVLRGGIWKGSPAIELSGTAPRTLYAVHPYAPGQNAPEAIPVSIVEQTDYLYTSRPATVSATNPSGAIEMRHALPMLAFNIMRGDFAGTGALRRIEIGDIPLTGTLDALRGTVRPAETGSYVHDCDLTVGERGWTESCPQFFVLPFASEGGIRATFRIDGADYACVLPHVEIQRGYKYIFRMTLTAEGLLPLPGGPEKTALDQEGDDMPYLPYGAVRFVHDNPAFAAPSFTGDGVVGLIRWGDGQQEDYRSGAVHTYAEPLQHTVTVETWDAEGFALPDLKGIEEIDLSGFAPAEDR